MSAASSPPPPAGPTPGRSRRPAAHEAFLRHGRRRLLGAGAIAILVVIVLVLLGPSRDEVRRRFESMGAEGPLRIMPELSIEPGKARYHQEPRYFRETPPPPNIEVVPEKTVPKADQIVPPERDRTETEHDLIDPSEDPDLDDMDLVEMDTPMQTNPCFILVRQVRPLYPAAATEAERRQAEILVEVAFFVDPEGEVTGSYVLSSTGGPAFAEVALKAVNQWRYRPVPCGGVAPDGFWARLRLRFRSPYGDS
jgi:TonB family protein